MPNKVIGYLLALAAACFWAMCGVVSKYFFNQSLSPLLLMTARLSFSALIMLVALRLLQPELLRIRRRDLMQFVILGVLGVATLQFTYLFTISQLNVATAVFLQYLAPALIALDSVFRKKEHLGLLWGGALLLACSGSALIITNQIQTATGLPWKGIITGFGSAAAFAFYTLYSQHLLRSYHSWTVLFYGFLFGAIPFWIFVPLPSLWQESLHWQIWLLFLYMAIFATIVPYILYLKSLQFIKGSHASLTCTVEPVLAGIFAYLLLGEVLTSWQLLGSALILVAVVLLQLERSP